MARIDELWGAPADDSPEAEEWDILLAITGVDEKKHRRLPAPSMRDMLEYHLDRVELSPEQIHWVMASREQMLVVITTGCKTLKHAQKVRSFVFRNTLYRRDNARIL